MSIETLPFEHRPRNSIANSLDRINELVDWVNLGTHLYASATGERVTVDDASSLKGLMVDGRSVQDGTPTPDAPVPVQVVEGPLSLVIGDASVAINLQGNTLASLPDGTRDELHVDSAGRVWIEKRVASITLDGTTNTVFKDGGNTHGFAKDLGAGYPASTYLSGFYNRFKLVVKASGNMLSGEARLNANSSGRLFALFVYDALSTAQEANTWLTSNPVNIYYTSTTPITTDLGYIDPPAIPSGSVVTISASLTPTIHLEWWVDDGITALIDDLIAYIDYKTEG